MACAHGHVHLIVCVVGIGGHHNYLAVVTAAGSLDTDCIIILVWVVASYGEATS